MKLRDFMLGVVTGLAAAYVVKEASEKLNPNKPANVVLKDIKNEFKKEGPIDGSWIFMQPDTLKKESIHIPVYRGGISRVRGGELESFEFAADSKTGTIVELVKV